MLNKVMLIGRLGADPDSKYTGGGGSGVAVCRLRIATDDSYTDRDGQRVERTEWHTVVAFNRLAETCANFLGKGSLVYVEGSLTTRKWEDANGQPRYTTEVRAQRVLFLDRKGEGQFQGDEGGAYQAMRGNAGRKRQQMDEDGPWEDAPSPRDKRPASGNRSAQQGFQGRTGQEQRRPPQYDDGPMGGDEGSPARGGSESGMDEVPF